MKVGDKVRVKFGVPKLGALTGTLKGRTVQGGAYDWWVDLLMGDETLSSTPLKENELICLGGKHAGLEHPENFTDYAFDFESAVDAAENHGKHAGLADYDAERDAWEAERAYL
mgnify:CR=1 FL=1